jgi:hypothetical protein
MLANPLSTYESTHFDQIHCPKFLRVLHIGLTSTVHFQHFGDPRTRTFWPWCPKIYPSVHSWYDAMIVVADKSIKGMLSGRLFYVMCDDVWKEHNRRIFIETTCRYCKSRYPSAAIAFGTTAPWGWDGWVEWVLVLLGFLFQNVFPCKKHGTLQIVFPLSEWEG